MTLFNNLSGEGSPAEKVTAVLLLMFLGKVLPPEREAPRKCQRGGAALGAEQVLSDLVSSPPLPARISPYRPSQAASRPCSLTRSETPNSPGRRGSPSRQTATPPLPGTRRPAPWPCQSLTDPAREKVAGPFWGLPDGTPHPTVPFHRPHPFETPPSLLVNPPSSGAPQWSYRPTQK